MSEAKNLEAKRKEVGRKIMSKWHREEAYREAGEHLLLGRQETDRRIVEQWWKSPEFRRLLQENPRVALENLLGIKFPEDSKIIVHRQAQYDYHIIVPHILESEEIENGLEGLSEEELESVAANFDAEPQVTGTVTFQHITLSNGCICCCGG